MSDATVNELATMLREVRRHFSWGIFVHPVTGETVGDSSEGEPCRTVNQPLCVRIDELLARVPQP